MARLSIEKATVRNRLAPRREPYWGAPIARGLSLGFRRTKFGGTWIARLHDDEKRHRYHSIGVLSADLAYETARSCALAWKRQMDAGLQVTSVESVADACREYVQDREKQKGKAAAHDAELRFRRTVYDAPIGRLTLAKLTQKRIEDWRDGLASSKGGRVGLSQTSLNRTLTALKAALNYAVARRYVSAERAVEWGLVKPFKVDNRRDLFLDLMQRRALLANASGGVRDLIEAVMLTGARAGELAPPAVVLFKRLSQDKLPKAHLFVRDNGKPWAPSDWDKLVRDAAASAKLPVGVCLYTLRHSFITEAITGGLSPLDVARLVGTSLVMIDKHYGHLAQTAARERLSLVNFV